MKKTTRLKDNTVYMCRVTGDLCVLRRTEGTFYGRPAWTLDKWACTMPEELNPSFKEILAEEYICLGDL